MVRAAGGLLLFVGLLLPSVQGSPAPGDVFWEYTIYRTDDQFGWFAVDNGFMYGTESGAVVTKDTAIAIPVPLDLTGAVKAEAQAQKAQVDASSGIRIQVNGRSWITFPEPAVSNWNSYQHHYYPTVVIPLADFKSGAGNVFKVRTISSGASACQLYGVTFRIYYGPDRPHPSGTITTVANNARLGAEVELAIGDARAGGAPIKWVQYVAEYEDVNYLGDGVYRQWQYHFYRKMMMHNIASHPRLSFEKAAAPYRATWATGWVPDQGVPMRIAARIIDTNNIVYMTPAVTGLTLERPGRTVELAKPLSCPPAWHARDGAKSVVVNVRGTIANLVAAKLYISTWNGMECQGIEVNGNLLTKSAGIMVTLTGDHMYSFNEVAVTPPTLFRAGQNTITIRGGAGSAPGQGHGTEVQYPGPMAVLQYRDPSVAAHDGLVRPGRRVSLRISGQNLVAPEWVREGTATVYDQAGREVTKVQCRDGLALLQSDRIAAGLYSVLWTDAGGVTAVRPALLGAGR